ncbi:MAG: bifunctional proline dehydrogenase/L-glutamate gamma-semialdehyde dehydrogenase PutA [Pseudomonadota bacterium]
MERPVQDFERVFTRKSATDVSYVTCARKLFQNLELVFPQFATHNARTVSTVLEAAGNERDFEFQRLQGMGDALHDWLVDEAGVPSRIYAPVGVHKDLLAYLVRRLLENGANSSFVNQIVNHDIDVEELIADPIQRITDAHQTAHDAIALPPALYGLERENSDGLNLTSPKTLAALRDGLNAFANQRWQAQPNFDAGNDPFDVISITNPANSADVVGDVHLANEAHAAHALEVAERGLSEWGEKPVAVRAQTLLRAADGLEAARYELMALCVREAGKTLDDADAELREAVDFLRYYALEATSETHRAAEAAGVFVCISPWNFPLAIFLGQISAALVMGNSVIAKPAEQTGLIAQRAVDILIEAGIPRDALVFLPGRGSEVGAYLTSHPNVAGVAFTGSTAVAQRINIAMANEGNPNATLVAETGGINAMIVDSTALPEQAVTDIIDSAFQSAGQRCSALRLLFLQDDVAQPILTMLAGAMAELRVGDPSLLQTDIGPVIDEHAKRAIESHVDELRSAGRMIAETPLDGARHGHFVAPVALRLNQSSELTKEVFGPVLHVCTFDAEALDQTVDRINQLGFGLTLGIHSRINTAINRVCERAEVGNIYVNRNQIGAIVGAQPFGGEKLSGTGPKAGGPHYLFAFAKSDVSSDEPAQPWPESTGEVRDTFNPAFESIAAVQPAWDERVNRAAVLENAADGIAQISSAGATSARAAAVWAERNTKADWELPGPTGEDNRLSVDGRGVFLCLGDAGGSIDSILEQVFWALASGNGVIAPLTQEVIAALAKADIPSGLVVPLSVSLARSDALLQDARLSGVAFYGSREQVRALRCRLASRPGPIIPLVSHPDRRYRFFTERTVSTDTTASGGNTALLSIME